MPSGYVQTSRLPELLGKRDGKRRRDPSAMVATYHSLAQIIIGC
jgi:hypothetical protein